MPWMERALEDGGGPRQDSGQAGDLPWGLHPKEGGRVVPGGHPGISEACQELGEQAVVRALAGLHVLQAVAQGS